MSGLSAIGNGLGIVNKLLGFADWVKQWFHDAEIRQQGIDIQKSADLEAQNKQLQAEVTVANRAPKTVEDVAEIARKGGL